MKKSRNPIPIKVSRGNVSVLERLRVLDKTQKHAVLATDSDGQPYTSLVAYALISDMKGIVFATPKDTNKYRNILKNRRVSLLIDTRSNTEKDYMGAESVTILGNAQQVKRSKKRSELASILTKKHPKLSKFIDSPEGALVFVEITKCIHVTRFQSVSEWHKG
ncbi:MAG: pyridoxamine 5'-phosphate oxidase family protein [Nitrospirota bacterium]|nr:pyridoxamine 5'-phosphate oxidase family protein [Nitrospirota bacterium]MDH5768378.1 pyridoxamine 5'-phosphate oxidase family protein [Nitrospirota bacterium]